MVQINVVVVVVVVVAKNRKAKEWNSDNTFGYSKQNMDKWKERCIQKSLNEINEGFKKIFTAAWLA